MQITRFFPEDIWMVTIIRSSRKALLDWTRTCQSSPSRWQHRKHSRSWRWEIICIKIPLLFENKKKTDEQGKHRSRGFLKSGWDFYQLFCFETQRLKAASPKIFRCLVVVCFAFMDNFLFLFSKRSKACFESYGKTIRKNASNLEKSKHNTFLSHKRRCDNV